MPRVRLAMLDCDGSGYLGEMQEFFAAIAEERVPASPAQDARRDLEITMRAYDALDHGGWAELRSLRE